MLANFANSNYNSLQVTFTKRYSKGLYVLAGYTYGHAIDTSSSNLADFPQNSLDYAAERGNGDFDIRNRFTLSIVYNLPSVKSKWQMLEGWQVTSIAMLEGGEPYTLGDFGDDISETGEFSDRWNQVGPSKNIHWSPTNTIPYINPDQFTVDGSGNVTGNQQCINAAVPGSAPNSPSSAATSPATPCSLRLPSAPSAMAAATPSAAPASAIGISPSQKSGSSTTISACKRAPSSSTSSITRTSTSSLSTTT